MEAQKERAAIISGKFTHLSTTVSTKKKNGEKSAELLLEFWFHARTDRAKCKTTPELSWREASEVEM